jgi:hypothetical protein
MAASRKQRSFPDVVEDVRHGARVTDAAEELSVPVSDLRKFCFAAPRLMASTPPCLDDAR